MVEIVEKASYLVLLRVVLQSSGEKINYLFKCFPIEIKVKYGVSALARGAFMTDLIHLFCAIRSPDCNSKTK